MKHATGKLMLVVFLIETVNTELKYLTDRLLCISNVSNFSIEPLNWNALDFLIGRHKKIQQYACLLKIFTSSRILVGGYYVVSG